MVAADNKYISLFPDIQQGNIATVTGTGAPVTLYTGTVSAFNYISLAVKTTAKDATIDIDCDIGDGGYGVSILSGHTVSAGTTHIELVTNVGYRTIRVKGTQDSPGTVDVYFNLRG
jgi:hypothetical protein